MTLILQCNDNNRQRRMRCIGKLQADRLALLEALAVEEKGTARLQWDMGSAFLVNDGTWDQMYVQDSRMTFEEDFLFVCLFLLSVLYQYMLNISMHLH